MLHRVVKEHLPAFLERMAERSDSNGVPKFIERELRRFLDCGVLAKG